MNYLHNLVKAFKLNLSFFISRRLAFNKETTFSKFVIRLSIAATTISVAAMILSLSFINGFQKVISDKVYSFWGHIRVQHIEPYKVSIAEESLIKGDTSLVKQIKRYPEIRSIQRFATRSAILKTNETLEGILFKGVDKDYHFDRIEHFRLKGNWPKYKDSGYTAEIVISDFVSKQLKKTIGEDLLIYFIQPGDVQPKIRKVKVSGIFRTGIDLYDKTYIIGDINLLRNVYSWDDDIIGGYEVVTQDPTRMLSTSEKIYASLPPGWTSRTMPELYPEIFDWLQLQNTNKYILLSVMSIVAIINLITCLLIMVLERTKMIGLLKAIGSNDGLIQRIFLSQGSIITSIGIVAGLFIGLGISFIQLKTGFITLDEEAYYMSTAPIDIVWWQVVAVCLATFVISILMLLIPSLISKKVNPIKAIQFR